MAHGPLYNVPFRRRREGKTDYRRRLALLKSGETRVVIRKSLRYVTVQFINYDETGDQVVATASSKELAALGWTGYTANLPAAYLTGLLAGKRAADAGVEEGVADLGLQLPAKGGRLFAALKGVVDGGVEVPHGDVLPADDRLRGQHINDELAAAFAATYEKIKGETPPAEL